MSKRGLKERDLNKLLKPIKFSHFKQLNFEKSFLTSVAFAQLKGVHIKVLLYMMARVQWYKETIKVGSRKEKVWRTKNNGDIDLAIKSEIAKDLKMNNNTISNAIHKLIWVGAIRITKIGGKDKTKHHYEILLPKYVKQEKQRWRKFPQENWEVDIPKNKNSSIGRETRFKKKQNPTDKCRFNQPTYVVRLDGTD